MEELLLQDIVLHIQIQVQRLPQHRYRTDGLDWRIKSPNFNVSATNNNGLNYGTVSATASNIITTPTMTDGFVEYTYNADEHTYCRAYGNDGGLPFTAVRFQDDYGNAFEVGGPGEYVRLPYEYAMYFWSDNGTVTLSGRNELGYRPGIRVGFSRYDNSPAPCTGDC